MENSKKIIMLGQKRVPSREGGIEQVVEELSLRAVRRGHNVTCLNRRGHHVSGKKYGTYRQKAYRGIELRSVLTVDVKGLSAMSASVSAAIYAAFSKACVVHFHALGPCVMLWLPKLFGKRCVATIHGLDHQREKWGKFAGKYLRLGERCAVKYADEIIVLSKNMQKYFRDNYQRETKYIPNGVNPPTIREPNLIRQKYRLEKDSYILFLSRIVPEKGLRYLVQAFKKVKTDKKLVIAGGSSDTVGFYNEIQELALADERIIFTGFVQGAELEELYSNSYAYILPSDVEGMPLSLLEAMSYGNCCVVSDIPELTEVVEERGIWFRKSDVLDLQKKLQKLLDDVAISRKYKRYMAEYYSNKYCWDNVVSETLKLYDYATD